MKDKDYQEIKIEGIVEIKNGDISIKTKNKFVQPTLQHILNLMSMSSITGTGGNPNNGPTISYNIYIGTDIITPTLYNTPALVAPIGTAPGTAPNSKGGTTSNPSAGIFTITITATWVAGAVSGTVGEMGLYMFLLPAGNLKSYAWGGSILPSSAILASRLAVADGAFSPFAINTANPLVITWTIQLSFV